MKTRTLRTRTVVWAALIGIGSGLVFSACTKARTGVTDHATIRTTSPEPQSTSWAPLSNRFTYIAFLEKDAADSSAD